MDFNLSEDQIAFQDMARDFAKNEMLPFAAKWDDEAIFPEDALRSAAKLGLAGIYCNSEHGGSELSRLDAAIIFEELSAACPSTAAYISIHNMASWMIDKFGTGHIRAKYLPRLMTMEYFASYCLTEPNAGSDAASLATKAELDGDYYILNGSKAFISGGGRSDIYVCMVRTGSSGAAGISAIIVEKGIKGLSFGAEERKLGWRSQPTTSVLFDNCRVPKENILGKLGQGFKIAMGGLDGGRINIGACSIGGARASMDAAIKYINERKQFGKKLSQFQALQFKIADMATNLDAARLMLHSAASKLDMKTQDATMKCAMAKRFSTDICFDIVNDALQLHGGYGYLKDFPIERYLRDLRVHQILEGTNEIMRLIISRDLLKN